jgi:hypothetical protein
MVAAVAPRRRSHAPGHTIHLPNSQIQRAGESDPGHVGKKKQRRTALNGIERRNHRDDRKPEQHQFDKREARPSKAEEERRPRGIKEQTDAVDGERHGCAREAGSSPHQPSGNRYREIEETPGGRKKPIRRPPFRLSQALIPFTGTEQRPGSCRKKAGAHKSEQDDYRRNVHMPSLCTVAFANDTDIPATGSGLAHLRRTPSCLKDLPVRGLCP